MYRTTVLDVPRSDMTTIDSLDHATTIVVVTSQEISSLRNAARIAETLRQRYGPARVKVVVNRFHREAVIAQEDVERVIGSDVKRIPSDYQVALEALNAGRPLVLDMESRLAKALVIRKGPGGRCQGTRRATFRRARPARLAQGVGH